jgi:hypothetical protein
MKSVHDRVAAQLNDAVSTFRDPSTPERRRVSTKSHGCNHRKAGYRTATVHWCSSCGALGVPDVGWVKPGPDAEEQLMDLLSLTRSRRR